MSGHPPGKAARWRALAALCVAALGIAALAGCSTPDSAQVAGSRVAVTFVAGPGQTASRSAVPWRLVGPGWTLAQDAAAPSNPAKTADGSTILYLLDPRGGRYRLFTWPAKGPAPYGELTDWSGDTQRALFSTLPGARQTRQLVRQLNLRTGKFTGFSLPADAAVLGYTRPAGAQILIEDSVNLTTDEAALIRISLRGQTQQALWRAAGIGGGAIDAPNGKYLVSDSYGALVLVSNAGGVIRHLFSPAICDPVRWWNSRTVLADCAPHDSAAARLWLIPVSGAKGTPLTPQRADHGADQGDDDLYQLTSGTYLDALGPRCGDYVIARELPHGKVRTYAIPDAPDASILTATTSRLLIMEDRGCSSPFPMELAWYDPATGRQTLVVPVSRQDVGVLAVVPYYQEGKL